MTNKQVLANYQKAAKHLQEAQKALQEIGSDYHNWSSEDARYYNHQIGELVSCDDGQTGIAALIDRLQKTA